MGLGPSVCTKCMILLKWEKSLHGGYRCPRCDSGDIRMTGLFEVPNGDLVVKRTDFYEAIPEHVKRFKIDMEYIHRTRRPFMLPDTDEPNVHYRPWLEKNVGKQGIKWDWDFCHNNLDMIEIQFTDEAHAVLFELTWP